MDKTNTKTSLSQEIMRSSKEIIKIWLKNNPNDSLLNVAQQINYSSVLLRTLGSNAEEEFKRKHKFTNIVNAE